MTNNLRSIFVEHLLIGKLGAFSTKTSSFGYIESLNCIKKLISSFKISFHFPD